MWAALIMLIVLVLLDIAVYLWGTDSRPGFAGNPEPRDTPKRAI